MEMKMEGSLGTTSLLIRGLFLVDELECEEEATKDT